MSFTADAKLRVTANRHLEHPGDSRFGPRRCCEAPGGGEILRSLAFTEETQLYLRIRGSLDSPIINFPSSHNDWETIRSNEVSHCHRRLPRYLYEVKWFIPSLTQTLAPLRQYAQRDPGVNHDRPLEFAFKDPAGQLGVELRFRLMH